MDELGKDYQLVIPEDTRYGRLDPETGTWTGTVGLAVEGVSSMRFGSKLGRGPKAHHH